MKLSDIPAIILYAICMYLGGIVFYQYITLAGGIGFLYSALFFSIVSLIAFFIPVSFALFGIRKPFRGLAYWTILMFLTWSGVYACNFLNNRSKVLLFAHFYWDAGIDLYLRENGTYKAIERGWIHDELKYGKYNSRRYLAYSGRPYETASCIRVPWEGMVETPHLTRFTQWTATGTIMLWRVAFTSDSTDQKTPDRLPCACL
ncbi:MAG: hypothetical protein KF852_14270 [Saprospiraceae bacterium]|nr:hypothetical protein [Saprospiraceae bacterium]